ncbi:MAG: hypothetical protein JO165_04465 [Candidatus Eremiobacteraeota bacterium]|nr:hypothetical protein [Candidatus Eremiobacteraeota bacterium]
MKRTITICAAIAALVLGGCGGHSGLNNGAMPQLSPQGSVIEPQIGFMTPAPAHFSRFAAPETPSGSISIGTDGAVYMDATQSFLRFNGSFTRIPYNTDPSRNVNSDGDINALITGPRAGADGTIWTLFRHLEGEPFTTAGRYDVTTRAVTESPAITTLGDENVVSLASGGDGNVWVTGFGYTGSRDDGFITIVTPSLGFASHGPTIPSDDPVDAITLAPDGGVYVATVPALNPGVTLSRIIRFDSHSYATTTICNLPAGSSVAAMTGASDGNVWFTDSGLNKIGRLGTKCALTYFKVPTASAGLSGITSAPDNALWFSEYNSNKIGRITTGGAITEYRIPSPGTHPKAITAAHGRLPVLLYFVENGALGGLTF